MTRFLRFNQLWQLIAALFREIIREPGVLFWGILFPILMSLGLGLAFTKKADVTRKVAVINNSDVCNPQTQLPGLLLNFCRRAVNRILLSGKEAWQWKYIIKDEKLGNSIFLFYSMQWKEAMQLLKRGTINVILLDNDGSVEYHFDPMNPDAQLTYLKLGNIFGKGK